jgi:hypothetical protein
MPVSRPCDGLETAPSNRCVKAVHQYTGSRSWRTNNPGQVMGVAVFQNPAQGRNALQAMLGHEELAGQTVASVLQRYIPNYTPPLRVADPTGETGVDLELTRPNRRTGRPPVSHELR